MSEKPLKMAVASNHRTPDHSLNKMAEASTSSKTDNDLHERPEVSASSSSDQGFCKVAEVSVRSAPDHNACGNEDPVKKENSSQVERYKRKPGRADMCGELFEVKQAALLFIRCLIQGHKFKIATNMNAAGSFDDIVLSLFGDVPIFIQLKHRLNERKIVHNNQLTQLNGDFALLKYCETFFTLKMHWDQDLECCGKFENSIFVLYTNASVECLNQLQTKQKKNKRREKEQSSSSESYSTWQSLLNTGGNYCSIQRDTHPEFYELFENVLEYKRALKETNNSEKPLNTAQVQKDKDVKEVPPITGLNAFGKDLEKLNGVDCYEEFLSRLWIFGGQTKEAKLTLLIENEVRSLLNVTNSKYITGNIVERFQEWWRYESYFIEENSELWQDILKPRWKFLSSTMMKELGQLTEIKFNQQEIKRLKKELSKNASMIHVVAADAPILTCLKAVRCLEEMKLLIVNRKTFKQHEKEIRSYAKYHITLILFGEYSNFAAFISSPQLKEGNCRVILISRNKHSYDTILDTCNISQLQENSRETILSKYICFQGQKVQAKSIIGQDKKCLSTISGETLLELLNGNKILSIGHPPTEVIKYFIDRTLQRKHNISKDILTENANFAISGTDLLQQFIPKGKKMVTYIPGQKVQGCSTIFKIKQSTDFEELSRTCQSIHWLKEAGECLQWMQSKGNIETIKSYLGEEQTALNCKDIGSLSERLIVVIAEPGMGKTTIMSSIAKEMKESNCTHWVINVHLNDYAKYLSGENPSPLGLLERALNINDNFQKCLLQFSLKVGGNIAVLLDGYDEICPYYGEEVIQIIQKLLHDTKVKQIWVTSRPVFKEKLEEKFCTLSYVLMPFSEADKKAFLCKFWNVDGREEFASQLLKCTHRCLNDKLGEFTGIPLQLMMLAEIFREEMLHFTETTEKDFQMELGILELYEKFIQKKYNIYYAEKLKQNVFNAGNRAEMEAKRNEFNEKHMICAIFAIFTEVEFSKLPSTEKLKQNLHSVLEYVQAGKEKTGIIMSVSDEKPTFIHRTFAEYFIAMWLVKNYSENQELVQHLLFYPRFDILWIFFDRYVTRGCKLHIALLNEDNDAVKDIVTSGRAVLKNVDECGRTALHLAVINYEKRRDDKKVNQSYLEMLKNIISFQKEFLSVSDKLLCCTPLMYANKIYAWEVINLLLQEGADEKDMEFIYTKLNNLWFLALLIKKNILKGSRKTIECVIRVKPDLVNTAYLIEVQTDVLYSAYFIKMPAINKEERIGLTPLHFASLEGQREVVELLIENGASLEARDNMFGETPLLWAAKSWQWDIVNLLIDRGAVIAAMSRERNEKFVYLSEIYCDQELIYFMRLDIHFIWNYNTNNEVKNPDIWKNLNQRKWTNIRLFLENRTKLPCHMAPKGNTLLHYSAKSADNKTLCLLLEHPEILNQINNENRNGLSPIEYAARAGKWDSVQTLLTHGAVCTPIVIYHTVALGRVDIMRHLLETPETIEVKVYSTPIRQYLLILAANSEQWNMFTFLINYGLWLPVYARTTVLHLAIKSKDRWLLDFVLDRPGLDVDVLNGEQETAFMCAARDANLNALEHLLDRGANPLLVHPIGGYTALHLAAECDDLSIVAFLLDTTRLLDDINRRDSQGSTPLMRALSGQYGFEVSRYLLQCDAECNFRYENGETLMHVAARNGNIELGELLLERGVSPLERDATGRSPLYVAISNGNVAFVEWLISQGANVYILDDNR